MHSSERHDLRCCPQYPTETCPTGNPEVRSSRNNVTSSGTEGRHDREAKAATPSIQGRCEPGSCGTVNSREALINVVT
jgi:hypothetical protein